jgi:predicted tellurium resistance membrane protein TerC
LQVLPPNRQIFVEFLLDPNIWIAFAMLVALEIVLGIDTIIFLSILVGRLPASRRNIARRLGLGLAMLTRILLLLSLAWIMQLTKPLFTLVQEISGRDLILIGGGLFLLWKSVHEIHNSLEGEGDDGKPAVHAVAGNFVAILIQIAIIDIVFSLDSVITAVGMVDELGVMVAAVVIAVGVMLLAAKPIGEFVERHPSVKVLALAFLVMVGMALVAEAFDMHVPKGYLYAAMAFSLAVEALNIRSRKKRQLLARQASSASSTSSTSDSTEG